MRKFMLAAMMGLAIPLGGCSTWNTVYSAVTGATVDTTTVYVAANSFDAVEITATTYLKQPRCTGTNGPLCRDTEATKAIVPAVRSAYQARKALVQYSIDHPGQLGPQGLYDALKAAGTTLQNVLTTYNIQVK
jgi:hypothetical protein